MDINSFLGELLQEISHLDFVDSIDFHIEVIAIKGRVLLKRDYLCLHLKEHRCISMKRYSGN